MASNNGLARRLESILDSIVMYTLSTSSKEMFVSRWILYNVANKATTKKRYSDTTTQRYTEPEQEPELDHA